MQAQLDECKQTVNAPDYRDITLIVDGTSMAQILDTTYAPQFVDISLKCHAVLCCRLSPIQKAKVYFLLLCFTAMKRFSLNFPPISVTSLFFLVFEII